MTLPYVRDEFIEMTKGMERKLQSAPSSSGILFVSVKAHPELNGKPAVITVNLGIDRSFPEATGMALIKYYLAEELDRGAFEIRAAVHRGVACPAERDGSTGLAKA